MQRSCTTLFVTLWSRFPMKRVSVGEVLSAIQCFSQEAVLYHKTLFDIAMAMHMKDSMSSIVLQDWSSSSSTSDSHRHYTSLLSERDS